VEQVAMRVRASHSGHDLSDWPRSSGPQAAVPNATLCIAGRGCSIKPHRGSQAASRPEVVDDVPLPH
jgi:hypothetical protein